MDKLAGQALRALPPHKPMKQKYKGCAVFSSAMIACVFIVNFVLILAGKEPMAELSILVVSVCGVVGNGCYCVMNTLCDLSRDKLEAEKYRCERGKGE